MTRRREWLVHREDVVFRAMPFVEVCRQKVETEGGVVVDDYYRVKLRDFVM